VESPAPQKSPKAKRTAGTRKSAKTETKPPRPWYRTGGGAAILGLAAVAILYVGYALFVSVSDGTLVEMEIRVGTNPDGSMYLRCGAGSSPGVCDAAAANPDQGAFRVEKRDRVHVTIFNDDGGNHTHDVRLQGGPYFLWPAGFEHELGQCNVGQPCATTSFTAWSAGTFDLVCELSGHLRLGMHGTLVVE